MVPPNGSSGSRSGPWLTIPVKVNVMGDASTMAASSRKMSESDPTRFFIAFSFPLKGR